MTTFLFPKSRQFGDLDEVCEQIVRELAKRQWNYPGIKVTLNEYRGYSYVSEIEGDDFKLWFCRGQGLLDPSSYDIAAVTELTIPGYQLEIFDDEGGPRLHVYVGRSWNWKRDRQEFKNGMKVHSKMDKKPRTYLTYTGSEEPGKHWHYRGVRPQFLVADNDLGREYDPGDEDPKYYHTQEVLDMFTAWLRNNVLNQLQSPELR